MRVRLRRASESAPEARIDDYLGQGEAWSLHTDGAQFWLHREIRTPDRYEVDRYSLSDEAARCVTGPTCTRARSRCQRCSALARPTTRWAVGPE